MQTILEAGQSTFMTLLPLAAGFGVLAFLIKRARVFEDLQRARAEVVTNLAITFFNAMIIVPLLAGPVAALRDVVPRSEALLAFWTLLPGALAVIIAVIVIDFAAYWRHRWEHTRALWPIHATHHADEAMNWLTLRRKHPLGEALSMVIDLLPVLLLGLPIWAIAVAALLRSAWGYFIHADVPWTLGPLGKVLLSPAAHRLHHIRDEALMGSNYGNTIALWDQLFGTYVDPAPYINCETGIAEGTRDFLGELARPFEKRYRRRENAERAPVDQPAV